MKLDELDIPEAGPIELLKRKLSPALHANQYEKAADTMYNVLQRKREENSGKFRHGLGYYAQQISRSFNKVDYRALMKYFIDKYPEYSKVFGESELNELKIEIPDDEGMGIPRSRMPQIKSSDYPEFIDYLVDNGADFKKETVPARSLKPVQKEFSKQGVEKQMQKRHDGKDKKPVIASSDNYIMDGHHRWLVALNTGTDVDIYRVNKPGKELLDLLLAFPKVYFKDIYNEDDLLKELTVKQSHIFKVVSNLADRKDNRPFPIKFYDGGTLEVQPSTAKRIIDFYYQANDALQTKLLKFLPTYNGFKEIAKAAGAVQESAGVGKITKQNSTPDVKPGETERQAKKFFGGNGKPKPLGVKGATPNQAFNLGLTEDVDGMPHLYLDMDGVQADFFTQWAKWHSEKTGQKVSSYRDIGDAEAQLASIIDMTNQGPEFVEKFFATLSPLNGFSPILNWIKKNNIPYSILSAPLRGNHKASVAGKKAWLSKHNPNAKEEIFTGTKEKYAMAGGQPNVLIDDHGKYITRWQSNGGIGIKHTDKNPQATISALEKIYSNQVEENMSVTGTRRGQEARKKKLRPGSEAWFKHWFSLPLMKRESFEQAKSEMLEYAKQYMQEGYRLQLERGTDMDVLHITDTTTGKRTEVRGKPDYERAYDPTDKLHQLLDKIGKASNISDLINGEVVGINPKHPDGSSAKKHADTAFNEGAEITMWTNPEYQGSDVDDEYYNKQPAKIIDINKLTPFEPADKMDDPISVTNMGKLVKAIQAGEKINPIIVVPYEGKLLIIDGHHRYFAHIKAGADKIPVVMADPKDLTWRDDVPVDENFKDGKVKGKSRPGRVERSGASCDGSVTDLRAKAKKSSGEKAKMYHWCANMKSGRK